MILQPRKNGSLVDRDVLGAEPTLARNGFAEVASRQKIEARIQGHRRTVACSCTAAPSTELSVIRARPILLARGFAFATTAR
jgi:hypothetical protein